MLRNILLRNQKEIIISTQSFSMPIIKSFNFHKDQFKEFENLQHGTNWPVVYIIHDDKEAYVWQTTNIIARSKQHFMLEKRKKLPIIEVISDETYNISAVLDTESLLIQYMVADGNFTLQNGNYGISNHQYYDKDKYLADFKNLWDNILREKWLVRWEYINIKNSDIFKYSPYKALSLDQITVASRILSEILSRSELWGSYIISWKPWTGKTILAIYLVKRILDTLRLNDLKIGFVVPMTALRTTLKKVFRSIKWLSSSMVIGPSDVVNTEVPYDILIVDEAHRLKRRKNITNFEAFDKTNQKLWLGNEWTELDWIMKCSKHQIFFYDPNQSIRPSDIPREVFAELPATRQTLTTQLRVEGWNEYLEFIEGIFEKRKVSTKDFQKYDFVLYDDISQMVSDIKIKDKEFWLCRMVAWYAWPWQSKNNPELHDIEIGETRLRWNSVAQDWINSKNAINEVGCIHTVQGYDLNYVGVIIWPELSYDFERDEFIIKKKHYHDKNGYRSIENDEVLKSYIINIYKTILTRGMKGCYVYIVDENLRRYFESMIEK